METENNFDVDNPWEEVTLENAKTLNTADYEIFYRPDGKECAKVRRVQ